MSKCWMPVACLALTLAPLATQAQDAAAVERGLLDRSNAFRAEQGLPPLQAERALTVAARDFARYMASTDRYGHEADGRVPADRVKAQGYGACMVAENIAMLYDSRGFSTGGLSQGFVGGWIASPGHRENLVSPVATEIGHGVAQSAASGRWYAVQLFGRPMRQSVEFEIANRSKVALRYSLDRKGYTLLPGVTRTHRQCVSPQLSLGLPGQGETLRLKPADGAKLRVEPGAQGLRLVQG